MRTGALCSEGLAQPHLLTPTRSARDNDETLSPLALNRMGETMASQQTPILIGSWYPFYR